MAKTIKIENFELQEVKIVNKDIHIEYWEKDNRNDLNSIDSGSKPSQDLIDCVNSLSEVLAESLGLLGGWSHARDHIKANEEATKKAMYGFADQIERCKVLGVTAVGNEENAGIKIHGILQTDYGNIKLPSGVIKFDDEVLGEKCKTIISELTTEVYLFTFKCKRDTDLFNQKETAKNDNPGGLGNSDGVLQKVS